MPKAKKSKQLTFTMPNRVGLLSEITTAIAHAKIGIAAIVGYEAEERAYFMMITDNNAKAKKVLTNLGGDVKEEELLVVEMPNKVGELRKLAEKLAAAGIDIKETYGTTGTGKLSTLVIKTADDKKALRVISK